MAKTNLTGVGQGGAGVHDKLVTAVKELQGLKFKTVAGAAANTNIAVAGAVATWDFIAAINLTDNADVAELPVFSAAGQIKFPTAVTTAKQILVVYLAK